MATTADVLTVTLADIAAAEKAEREAARDAYRQLVQEMAAESLTATPGQVVAVLKRAGRSTGELGEDVGRAKRVAALAAVAGELEARQAEQAKAAAALKTANAVWEKRKAEIDAPAAAAAAAYEAARERVREAANAATHLNGLREQQRIADARRAGKSVRAADVEITVEA